MRTPPAIYRNIDCAIVAPPAMFARDKRSIADGGQNIRPIGNAQCDVIGGYKMVSSLVSSLLLLRRPSYVATFIVSIYVYAIKGMFRCWSTPYFGEKIFKRLKPKLNSPIPIVFINGIIGVIATSFGVDISRKLYRFIPIGGFAMRCPRFLPLVLRPASTRFGFATFQGVRGGRNTVSTFTLAIPVRRAFMNFMKAQNGQIVKNLSGQIDEIGTGWFRLKNDVIFVVRHLIKANSFNCLARAASTLQSLVRPVLILAHLRGAL